MKTMNTKVVNEADMQQADREAQNAYVLYAYWSHELASDHPVLRELYKEWKEAEARLQDILLDN